MVGLPETGRVVVGGLAHHSRVLVSEEAGRVGAEDGARLDQFGDTAFPQDFALVQHAVGHLALLALGRAHEDDPVAGVGRPPHEAAGGDGLVIGVGMEADQCGHGAQSSPASSSALSRE